MNEEITYLTKINREINLVEFNGSRKWRTLPPLVRFVDYVVGVMAFEWIFRVTAVAIFILFFWREY